jgi:outer membrane protein TolC
MQNQDTLFLIAKGRYNLGTIAEDALLQMQLRYMQAQSSLQSARMNLQSAQSNLRSFLGFNEKVELELVIDFKYPDLQVAYEKALELALSNSPDILSYELSCWSLSGVWLRPVPKRAECYPERYLW